MEFFRLGTAVLCRILKFKGPEPQGSKGPVVHEKTVLQYIHSPTVGSIKVSYKQYFICRKRGHVERKQLSCAAIWVFCCCLS